jgi:phosphoglycerate dehydrogenase-like enzyme
MKKIVSFFGEKTPVFESLNEKASVYAEEKGMEYFWSLQTPFDQEEVVRQLKHADAGIIDIQVFDKEIFREIQGGAQILIRFGVGYDKVNLKDASEYGLAIARTTGANATGVAEMAVALIFAARRRLAAVRNCVYSGKWEKIITHETIGSAVIGVLGFGLIGKMVAKNMGALGCKVLVYDPYADEKAAAEIGARIVTLDELFKSSDAVTVHAAYTEETHHIVSREMLSLMKPSSVVVNTSRGSLIDEKALYEALTEKKIAGAGLDVYSTEPLPLDSPLLKLDSVMLTPHL